MLSLRSLSLKLKDYLTVHPCHDIRKNRRPDFDFRLWILNCSLNATGPRPTSAYRITRSARTMMLDGIARPSPLAAFKFTTRSYRVGCSTAISPGLAPESM